MLTAARTAPKAKGLDLLECCLVTGDDIQRMSAEMQALYEETGRPVFKRDGENILKAGCVVVKLWGLTAAIVALIHARRSSPGCLVPSTVSMWALRSARR